MKINYFTKIKEKKCDLIFFNQLKTFVKNAERVFFLSAKKNCIRGNHAHKICSQYLISINGNIKIIDIEQENPYKFIKEVLGCKKIISSSLHGIIISDSYDIPALRVKFSDKISGGDFKFHDYFMSINRVITKPHVITEKVKISDILQLDYNYYKKIDLELLIKSCPFNRM